MRQKYYLYQDSLENSYICMVRENRVFHTQAQKVYPEDILRALRVSSFFRLRCKLILMNVYLDLTEKSRGESLNIL